MPQQGEPEHRPPSRTHPSRTQPMQVAPHSRPQQRPPRPMHPQSSAPLRQVPQPDPPLHLKPQHVSPDQSQKPPRQQRQPQLTPSPDPPPPHLPPQMQERRQTLIKDLQTYQEAAHPQWEQLLAGLQDDECLFRWLPNAVAWRLAGLPWFFMPAELSDKILAMEAASEMVLDLPDQEKRPQDMTKEELLAAFQRRNEERQ